MKTIINLSISIKIERARTLPCTVLVEKWPAVGVWRKKSLAKDVAGGGRVFHSLVVRGKNELLYAVMFVCGTKNLEEWPLVEEDLGVRCCSHEMPTKPNLILNTL